MSINTSKHVAVLAFPSSSHPKTMMDLLLKLSNSAPHILFSFFSTQKSNESLLSSYSDDLQLPSNIKIYDVEDGVPMGYQFTGKPHEQVNLFLKAAPEILTRRIETVVAETGMKISCIISDAFLTFSGEIADKFDASWVALWVAFPTSLSAHFYTQLIRNKCATQNIGKDELLDFVPGLSILRVKDLPAEVLAVGEKESAFSKELSQIGEKLAKANAVIINCFEELVPEVINNDLKSKFINYLNLGFISMTLPPPPQLPESDSDATGCLSWLDKQPSKSVAYIAFGTKATLPEKELKALAEALEFSKIPFLWSLKENLKEKLPNGFVERTSKQGKIVAWTPQTLVLAHDSVAIFISHAGFNSVCESIVYGVPMICRPVFGDHMTMARMVEVGWEIGVTVEDGVITKIGLLKILEMFFQDDDDGKVKKMRENVHQLKKVVLMAALPGCAAAKDFNKLTGIISMV
ncbi:kaempferol 3-O-beta-D-galactosyltransferase-like [Euphorbia lathyris]|uniref:kaempferol 3-O-beta-D-galactosyltransferase-like n=1 Tax=Euphorbia lathyris TaxID=212925 RepID=UPI003313F12C